MKWVLNTTVGRATFSSGRKSRLVFRSCQQPRELDQGTLDAGKGTHEDYSGPGMRCYYKEQAGPLTPLNPRPCQERRCKEPQQRCPNSDVGTVSVQSQGGVLRKILHDPPRTDSNHPRNAGVLSQLCPHTARPWDVCAGEAGVTPPRAGQGAALGAFPEGCAGGSSDAGL